MIFNKHVSTVVRACNFHLSALPHIRSLVSDSVAQQIACSIVGSRLDYCNSLLVNCSNRNHMTSCSVCRTIWPVSSATPTAQHQLDHCYGACTGCQSGSGSTSNSPNFVIWSLLPTAKLPRWFDQPVQSVSLAAIIHTEASVSSAAQLWHCCSSFFCCCSETLELSSTELSNCSIR